MMAPSGSLQRRPIRPAGAANKRCAEELEEAIEEMQRLQHMLYAQHRHAVLLVFQAMDAAEKDGTIRAVMSGINPAGCQVYSFKEPSSEEPWQQRFTSIRAHEEPMARSGTVILEFWLNVSKQEQRKRLLARIDDARKNWKFFSKDIEERDDQGVRAGSQR